MRSIPYILVAFALVGCDGYMNPGPLPTGYTYHHDVYKSAPGPEAESIGYSYSRVQNEEVLQIWRIVAKDLVDQLEEETQLSPQSVYMEGTTPESDGFLNTYDHVLREELRERGYSFASAPGEGLHLLREVQDMPAEDKDKEESAAYGEYVLIITAMRAGGQLGQVGGIYKLPAYGQGRKSPMDAIAKPITGGERK